MRIKDLKVGDVVRFNRIDWVVSSVTGSVVSLKHGINSYEWRPSYSPAMSVTRDGKQIWPEVDA